MRAEPGAIHSAGRRSVLWSISRPCSLIGVGLLGLVLLTTLDAIVSAQQRPWPLVVEDPSVTPVVGPSWLTHLGLKPSRTNLGSGAGRYGPPGDQKDGAAPSRLACGPRVRSPVPTCIA
jgi:hypothetical protein